VLDSRPSLWRQLGSRSAARARGAPRARGRGRSRLLGARRPTHHHPLPLLQAQQLAAYLNFLARLPPLASAPAPTHSAPLPPQAGRPRPTLVLDLDHTLVRSVALPPGAPAPPGATVVEGATAKARTAFERRPGLDAFLTEAAALFEVVVFTAGSREYAAPVLAALDPQGGLFAGARFRDACTRVKVKGGAGSASKHSTTTYVVKDVARLGRDPARVVVVDNSPTAYAFCVAHALPVASWHGAAASPGDDALPRLMSVLRCAAVAGDVRELVARVAPAAAAAAAAAAAGALPALAAPWAWEEQVVAAKAKAALGGGLALLAAAAGNAPAAPATAPAALLSSSAPLPRAALKRPRSAPAPVPTPVKRPARDAGGWAPPSPAPPVACA
jgi:CTD small phosphatase-like protein 2